MKSVLLAALVATSSSLFTEDAASQKYMWEEFKTSFNKNYATQEEENTRFGHFVSNLRIADQRNLLEKQSNGTAVHGITKFSDLSTEEFKSHYLTSDMSMKTENKNVHPDMGAPDASAGLVDWTGVLTTPVKNQGYCGSCWAFSATEQIESDTMRVLGQTQILSPQQITSCDKTSMGCNGGWTEHAYNYVQRNGLELDADYPYTSGARGVTGDCNAVASKEVVTVTGYTTINGESNMAAYMQKTGPLSVCLDAASWNMYTGGIMSVCGKSVDHCVQATGVDASSGGYWKVRNSWGTDWGESGFIRLAYGSDTCAITSDPTYVAPKIM
jgi:C1A family cysteine protease